MASISPSKLVPQEMIALASLIGYLWWSGFLVTTPDPVEPGLT